MPRSIWLSAASRAFDLSMDEPSTTRSAAVISRSIWLTIRRSAKHSAGAGQRPMQVVHYLFSVRNMFFSSGGVLVPFDPHWSLFRIGAVLLGLALALGSAAGCAVLIS